MNKKTLLTIAVVAALVVVLLLVGMPLFSRLYYGRSLNATLFAWQFEKDEYIADYYFQEYLLQKKLENAEPYAIPQDSAAYPRFVKSEAAGVRFYSINGTRGADRVVFYFPGGSYIDQPREVHWRFLTRLADDTDARIVVPIYPKLPENDAAASYAALADAYAAYMQELDYDELIFMGDSAGGGMALSFAMQLRDAGMPGPDQLILICPWLDVTLSNPDIPAYEKRDPALDAEQLRHLGALWAGDLAPTDPIVSPLYGSFDGLGRITLVTGTAELLYPDILVLSDELTAAGIPHDLRVGRGMFHVWPLYIGYSVPEAEETYRELAALVGAPS